MGMPAEQGLAVLYVLADQWLRERQIAAGLGTDPAPLDTAVGRGRPAGPTTDRADLVRALGGEVN